MCISNDPPPDPWSNGANPLANLTSEAPIGGLSVDIHAQQFSAENVRICRVEHKLYPHGNSAAGRSRVSRDAIGRKAKITRSHSTVMEQVSLP